MKKTLSVLAIAGAALATSSMVASAGVLEDVKARGELNCLVSTGLAGFAYPDASGRWEGLDVDFCRATAAAIFGDPDKVKFVPASSKNRFTILNSGEADVLYRTTTITMSRDVDLKMTFLGVNFYDGQGFMVPKSLGAKSATELDGASVCIQTGTTTELNLADYFRTHKMSYEPVPHESSDEGKANFEAGRCDLYTTDASGLAAIRSATADPSKFVILDELISKEPLGPAVRQGDEAWADLNRWVLNVIIAAEEYGITQANVEGFAAKSTGNPNIDRITGVEGEYGPMIGLEKDWAVKAIKAVGNYGEIFERHVGVNTPIGLARGSNAQWNNGGILYAPPIR